nr:hypothetical protein [uncultured Flavobacterium sp.]
MTKQSQASYAARLARAEQFYQLISTLQNYNPGIPELTPESFQRLVTQLSETQLKHSTTHHEFSEAVRHRKNTFTVNPNSLAKTLTLVKSYVRAKNGTNSPDYNNLNTFIKKIREEKPSPITTHSSHEIISRCERVYNNQLQHFAEIIRFLEQYGPHYNPTNVAIKIPALNTLHAAAAEVNNTVTHKFSIYQPRIDERQIGFKKLTETTTRIKEMVKSQYGANSIEYNMIKGINFKN